MSGSGGRAFWPSARPRRQLSPPRRPKSPGVTRAGLRHAQPPQRDRGQSGFRIAAGSARPQPVWFSGPTTPRVPEVCKDGRGARGLPSLLDLVEMSEARHSRAGGNACCRSVKKGSATPAQLPGARLLSPRWYWGASARRLANPTVKRGPKASQHVGLAHAEGEESHQGRVLVASEPPTRTDPTELRQSRLQDTTVRLQATHTPHLE